MKKEILDKIKQDVDDMRRIIDGDYSEITELEKDPKVQRYLYLKSLIDSRDLIEYGKGSIICKIIEIYGRDVIKESNNIWCYLYESDNQIVKDVFANSSNKDEVMVVYNDLEDSSKIMAIGKSKQEEFEATHNVVYGKFSIQDYSDRYYNTRCMFFNDCINLGQEEAVKKILRDYPKK